MYRDESKDKSTVVPAHQKAKSHAPTVAAPAAAVTPPVATVAGTTTLGAVRAEAAIKAVLDGMTPEEIRRAAGLDQAPMASPLPKHLAKEWRPAQPTLPPATPKVVQPAPRAKRVAKADVFPVSGYGNVKRAKQIKQGQTRSFPRGLPSTPTILIPPVRQLPLVNDEVAPPPPAVHTPVGSDDP